MLGVGLEPTFLAEPDPKSGASANFATRACEQAVRRSAEQTAELEASVDWLS